MRVFSAVLFLAMAGGGFALCTDALPGQPWCRIDFVRLNGEAANLDARRLQDALMPELDKGFFALSLDRLERIVRTFAWVDKIRVARVWPGTVILTITEHKAVARWGDNALLSDQGWRFAPEEGIEYAATLPRIIAPAGTEHLTLETLRTLNAILESKSLSVSYMELSPRYAWIIRLNNGLEMHFGRQDPPKPLNHFLEIIAKIGDDGLRRLQRADLRYHSGFAVVWNPERTVGKLGENSVQTVPAAALGGATNQLEKVQ
jgi:cell division protein FtsQ